MKELDRQPIKKPKDYIHKNFDVTDEGEYLGMPRMKEYMAQTLKELGIDFDSS
jgi:hypothetical protein